MAVNNQDVLKALNSNISSIRSGLYGGLTTKLTYNEAEEVAKTKSTSKER